MSLQGKHAGAWLHAYPGSKLFTFSDKKFTMALRLRLGLAIIDPDCPMRCKCGTISDPFGDHFLSCKKLSNKFNRHKMIVQAILTAASMARYGTKLEYILTQGRADISLFEVGSTGRIHTDDPFV